MRTSALLLIVVAACTSPSDAPRELVAARVSGGFCGPSPGAFECGYDVSYGDTLVLDDRGTLRTGRLTDAGRARLDALLATLPATPVVPNQPQCPDFGPMNLDVLRGDGTVITYLEHCEDTTMRTVTRFLRDVNRTVIASCDVASDLVRCD